jgi:uncharacterized protein (DUF1501 family)
MKTMMLPRRKFLTHACALSTASLTAASMTGFGLSMSAIQAAAQSATQNTDSPMGDANVDYKALVCVFLLGGLDGNDTILPYDSASYSRYAALRQSLLQNYANVQGGSSSRSRDRLLPLNPVNPVQDGRQFALTEELSGLHALFEQGQAAIVANVGPLVQKVTLADYEADAPWLPKRLFSHNDQQATWMAGAPEGASLGWGGRFADAALRSGANISAETFTAITSTANALFLTGESARPFQIGRNGAPLIDSLTAAQANPEQYALLRDHFAPKVSATDHLLERDFRNAMGGALRNNEAYNAGASQSAGLSTAFPGGPLGDQLRTVAQAIAARKTLQVSRQVFFVGLGGFDTHSNQVLDLPPLQRQLDAGITAFVEAMRELGTSQDVTLFTASDFGRTLAVNGDGTDHGWGNHHFVVGDAVNGRRILGELPPYDLAHALDAGGGRWIPEFSVEQFAAPLGCWFGLNDAQLQTALPNLNNFNGSALSYFT